MDDKFFKELGEKETELFKQWAVDTFVPGMQVNPCWHPVVRAEMARLQAEFEQHQEAVETPLGEQLDGFDYDEFGDCDPNPYHGDYSED